ncbi:undecaprenyl-diphosphate phosphatase [Candidatus Microgenomates bacterium]|nr:undecaprenyl-diphosphate phosphatase [Candidatus Microgenomates bacterium]
MNSIQAIILGLVEGLTEFLPVSSTGHLILTADILGLKDSSFLKNFEITIQSGAILAVIFLYWRYLFDFRHVLSKLLVAFIPTGIAGIIFYPFIKNYLLGNTMVVLWSLLLGGIFLIIFDKYFVDKLKIKSEKIDTINLNQAVFVGILQILSFIPGVSRSAATIIAGQLIGFNRKLAVEFSFLLAVPTMLVATAFSLLDNVDELLFASIWPLALSFIFSFFAAILAIRWFVGLVEKKGFIIFGIYRIVLSAIFFLIFVR